MPTVSSDGCPLHVEIQGPESAPALVLSSSLGTDHTMWDRLVPLLARHFRLVRYDHRGHGRSGVTPGPYDMARLGRDVIAILDGLEIDGAHFCGLSIGGMVGQWLAAEAPERVDRLVLANTGCFFENKTPWNDRIATIREHGLEAIVDGVMDVWFTESFRSHDPDAVRIIREHFLATPQEGYIACGEAVRDMDQRALLEKITAPTLVIAGRFDNSTPLAMGAFIRSKVANAQFTILDSAHLSPIEQAAAFETELLGFLTS